MCFTGPGNPPPLQPPGYRDFLSFGHPIRTAKKGVEELSSLNMAAWVASEVTILILLMVALVMPSYLNTVHGISALPFDVRMFGFEEETDDIDPRLDFEFPKEALPTRSGYIALDSFSRSRMFYAFYEALEPNKSIAETPIILWLQGGPGCSSMIGNFYELGPWTVSSHLQLYRNPSPWNHRFGLLFIDNPVGSGFSIAERDEDIPTDQYQVAGHLYTALAEFYRSIPGFKNRSLFVAGESYAGKYVPALGHYILREKSKRISMENEGLLLPSLDFPAFHLAGLIIGNGLTDPEVQVQTHASTAYSFGLIDKKQKTYVEELAKEVVEFIHKQEWFEAYKSRTALVDWIQKVTGIATVLDVRREVPYHCSSRGKDFLPAILNRKSVKAVLNASEVARWVSCNPRVRRIMANDTMKSAKWMVEEVLEDVPVLLYQGQYDIKDGVVSSEEWMSTMSWRGTQGFRDTQRNLWVVDDKVAGYWRSYENLTHVVVLGAGHEVPADQGLHSQKMIEKWIAEQLG